MWTVLTLATGACFALPAAEGASVAPRADNAALAYLMAIAALPELNEADAQVFSGGSDRPIDEAAVRLIDRSKDSLRLLRRGAAMKACSWGWDPAETSAGGVWLPFSNRARNLARLAALRARHNFERRENAEAVEDVAALLAFARRFGEEPTLGRAMGFSFEGLAVSTAARHLPGLDPAAARAFAERLDRLTEADSPAESLLRFADAVAADFRAAADSGRVQLIHVRLVMTAPADEYGEAAVKAMGGDVGRFRRWVEQLGPLRARLAEAAGRPAREVAPALAGLVKDSAGINPLAPIYLAACAGHWQLEARSTARLAMFRAALAVVAEGPGRVAEFRDPFGTGPFRYQATGKGFVLESALDAPDSTAFLRVFRSAMSVVDPANAEQLPVLPARGQTSKEGPGPNMPSPGRWRLVVGPEPDASNE